MADQATIDKLCDPGIVDHNPAPGHEPTLTGFKEKVAGFKALFPDLEEDLQEIIAGGDTIATRWVVTGTLQKATCTSAAGRRRVVSFRSNVRWDEADGGVPASTLITDEYG